MFFTIIYPVTTSGSRQTLVEAFLEAPKNGYAYIYVSNESNNLVYFDNFQVSHVRGPLLEENHFYPFGSKMTAICSKAMPNFPNSYGYQSKKLDDEFDIDLYDFHARSYDPQTGRFLQSDPDDQFASGYIGMGNAWINSVDPDGKSVLVVALIFAGVQLTADLIRSDFNMTIGEMGRSALKGAAQGGMACVFGGSAVTNLKALGMAVAGQLPAIHYKLIIFPLA